MTEYEKLIDYGRQSVDDYISIVEKQLARQYRDAFKYAESELARLYAKLGDEFTLGEAKKYNRYGNMMESIKQEYKKLTGKALKATESTSTASVIGGYDANWFAIENGVENTLAFGNLPVDAVRASVYSEYSGANIITRYGKLYQTTVDKVAQEITRGLATGTGYAKTAQQVKDIYGISFNDTMRIIRTESTRAWTEGSLKSYERAEEVGIEGVKTWLSTRDGRTRDRHAQLNGKGADKKGLFRLEGMSAEGPGLWGIASMDIQCRCTTYFELNDVKGLPNWSYDDWKKEYGKWQKEPAKRATNKTSSSMREKILNYKPKKTELELADDYRNAVAKHDLAVQEQIGKGLIPSDLRKALADKNDPNYAIAKKIDKLSKERTKAYELWSNSPENLIEEYKKLLEIDESDRFDGDIISQVINGKKTRSIKEGESFVRSIVKKDRLQELKIYLDNRKFKRASFNDKYMTILGPKNIDATTVAHEITHSLEYNSKKISEKSKAFLQKRAGGEAPKKLKDVVDQRYRDDEIFYEDDFFKNGGIHYSGKIYKDEATELVTTGVERLFKDPLKFAQQDPEFFDFVIDIIQGEI